jgi:hypothetical protein
MTRSPLCQVALGCGGEQFGGHVVEHAQVIEGMGGEGADELIGHPGENRKLRFLSNLNRTFLHLLDKMQARHGREKRGRLATFFLKFSGGKADTFIKFSGRGGRR